MAESPSDLLRQIRDEFRDLPERLADQLGKQREMVLRGELPGDRREEEREEREEGGHGERRRDEHGRFLPGSSGGQRQGAFAKIAAHVQHAESLFNAIDRFQKALAKSREPKEEASKKPKELPFYEPS